MITLRQNTRLLIGLSAVIIAFLCFGFLMRKEKEIIINLDGSKTSVLTRCITVNTVLREQDISWKDKDFVFPAPDQLVKPSDVIHLYKCVPVEIETDGNLISLEHTSADVFELCNAAGITLGPLDKVEGTVDKTDLPVRLSVIRVQEKHLEIEETVPCQKQKTLDPDLAKGRLKILQNGEDGLIRKKYLVRYENGREITRREIESVVLREAKPEVTALGTKGTMMISSRSPVNPKRTLLVQATAYTHTGNTTFTGTYPHIGTIAVDPQVIPLGSRMWVEGYGYGIAQDTGGLIRGDIIDLFMDTEQDCWRWGRRRVKVYILE